MRKVSEQFFPFPHSRFRKESFFVSSFIKYPADLGQQPVNIMEELDKILNGEPEEEAQKKSLEADATAKAEEEKVSNNKQFQNKKMRDSLLKIVQSP